MPTLLSRFTALAVATLLCACQPDRQPPAAPPASDAVATLDGTPVSRALLDEMARQQSGVANPYDAPAAGAAASAASAPAVDRKRLLDELIDIELLARKARERGIDKQPAIVAESELQAKSIVAQRMLGEQIATLQVSDAELAAFYEERVPPHQFRLAQIVVPDATLANSLLGQLQQGRSFAELARRHSIDTGSRDQGGELGWLMAEQMPLELLAAVRHLKPGQHAPQAIQTHQGWHLLQLQALQPLPERPSLETARVWLHPQIVHAKVEALQKQWRQEAKVQLDESP